uniref:Uncharacterized protein n=1 Tax=Strongyloides venezuelensis TaxID=75913 RepID=A0A0K0G1E5_STRVS
MSDFLCIVLFLVIIYLLYYPTDPLGVVRKFRSVTFYPTYSRCFHISDIVENPSANSPLTTVEKTKDKSKKSTKKVKKVNPEDVKTIGLTPGPGIIVTEAPSKFEESEFLKQSMRKKENRGK